MNRYTKKILNSGLLALLLCCLICTAAFGETMLVLNAAPAYVQPDTSSKSVTLPAGTSVDVVAEKNGWAMIQLKGKTGYMQTSWLTRVESGDGRTVYASADAPVYKSYSTASKQIATLPAGTAVKLQAIAGEWACVSRDGHKGFVKKSLLTSSAPQAAVNPTVTATPAPTTSETRATGYAAQDGVKVYQSYSTDSAVVATLSANAAVTVLAVKNGWCLVEKDGSQAYMRKSDLTATPQAVTPTAAATPAPGGMSITAYAAEEGVKAYQSYSTDSAVVATLPLNAVVTVTAAKEGWCQIQKDGLIAYMKQSDLAATAQATPAPTAAAELKFGDTGDEVKALQTRLQELGYFSGAIGGNYGEQTQTAVLAFQRAANLTADGVAGADTLKALASSSAPKATAAPTTAPVTYSGESTVTPARGTAKEMDWWTSDIQTIFARETVAQVTDIETGISWREIRRGGTNHADVQPLTAADTAAMKKACGSWSWNRRAIWVTINGVNYAASMNCMPHGSGSITNNNFDGHHCIHFTNSRTHGTNRVCPQHQAAIKKAAAASR